MPVFFQMMSSGTTSMPEYMSLRDLSSGATRAKTWASCWLVNLFAGRGVSSGWGSRGGLGALT